MVALDTDRVTLELLVIAVVRVLGSLPVLRWPLAGGLLAVLVDLSDLFLRDLLDLGGVPDYQSADKWLDQVYQAAFLVVALRWAGPERTIAIGLYGLRLIGFAAFELTGERMLLIVFPNVFELWFLLVALVHRLDRRPDWTVPQTVTTLLVLLVLKETQEVAIHGLKLFDGISAVGAVDLIVRWITGAG